MGSGEAAIENEIDGDVAGEEGALVVGHGERLLLHQGGEAEVESEGEQNQQEDKG